MHRLFKHKISSAWLLAMLSFCPFSLQAIDGIMLNAGTGMDDSLIQSNDTRGASQVSAGIFWNTETSYKNAVIGYGELNIETYFSHLKNKDSLNLISVRPVITFWGDESKERLWFWQAGIGLAYLDSKKFDSIILSSHGQFSTLLGLGVALDEAKKHQLTLRYNHYSNANIKLPNPGLDMISLDWSYQW